MALIHIKADGTFEAVANAIANQRAAIKARLTAAKQSIKDLTADLRVANTIGALKGKLTSAQKVIKVAKSKGIAGTTSRSYVRAVQESHALKAKIDAAKKKLKNPRHTNPALVTTRLKKAKIELTKVEGLIKSSNVSKTAMRNAKLDGPKPNRENPGRTRRSVTRKVSFDTEARRASNDTVRGIKSKLRELDAKSKLPTKKKPAASTTKHTGSVKTGAKATVLKTIKQLKADIAKGLSGPKLERAQAELKKQRAALRQLRKGESAKNAAAVAPRTKASKAGMGSADKKPSSNEKRIESLRAKLKPLKPGSPEYRQIMTKIKTLQGRSPVGGNR